MKNQGTPDRYAAICGLAGAISAWAGVPARRSVERGAHKKTGEPGQVRRGRYAAICGSAGAISAWAGVPAWRSVERGAHEKTGDAGQVRRDLRFGGPSYITQGDKTMATTKTLLQIKNRNARNKKTGTPETHSTMSQSLHRRASLLFYHYDVHFKFITSA